MESMLKQEGKEIQAARVHSIQHSNEAYANLLVALYNALLNTFSFLSLMHKEQQCLSNLDYMNIV